MPEPENKILSLEDLADLAKVKREEGNQIVLCHGEFDLMRSGHIRHLQNSRQKGDILLVTVTCDKHIQNGPGRPMFHERLRAENLAALSCVDFVAINYSPDAIKAISLIKPDLYMRGSEHKNATDDFTANTLLREKNTVEAIGGKMEFTSNIMFSSSSLLNEYFGIFSSEAREYLKDLSSKYNETDVINKIKSLSNLKVLIIGDTIIDEYHYTTGLGQSAKGTHLSVKYESTERFAGGSIAVANHISEFADSVTLVTALGKENNHEEFIRSKLSSNVKPIFTYFSDAPTIVKQRFVDGDLNKLFEVYNYNEAPSADSLNRDVCPWLNKNIHDFDIVISTDFGNGFISPEMIDVLCKEARFLVVNTQVNSGNRGYHAINRYPRANFISLNGPELRMATHNRNDPLEKLAEEIAAETKASFFAVTLGSKGAILLETGEKKLHKAPILSTTVLDRIGAGDAFLSFSGLCLGGGLPAEVALFVGSAAAALDVQIICNREHISKKNIYQYICTLLK